jgi:hypothetical protein
MCFEDSSGNPTFSSSGKEVDGKALEHEHSSNLRTKDPNNERDVGCSLFLLDPLLLLFHVKTNLETQENTKMERNLEEASFCDETHLYFLLFLRDRLQESLCRICNECKVEQIMTLRSAPSNKHHINQ